MRLSFQSPLGPITLYEEGGAIISLRFENSISDGESDVLMGAMEQLIEYMQGERRHFDIPVRAEGTEYQKKVWETAMKIPYGETRSYEWVSRLAGGSPRSAGNALSANPVPIVIPCHRIVKKDGKIGGYSSGIEIKKKLIDMEQLHLYESVLK